MLKSTKSGAAPIFPGTLNEFYGGQNIVFDLRRQLVSCEKEGD
jgi:hypothetical protein